MQPNAILQSSINIIGAADLVSQAVGLPAAEVRQICDDSNRWTAVADELRAMLNSVDVNEVKHKIKDGNARTAHSPKNYFPILPIMLKYCPCQRTRELERGFTREFPFPREFAVEKFSCSAKKSFPFRTTNYPKKNFRRRSNGSNNRSLKPASNSSCQSRFSRRAAILASNSPRVGLDSLASVASA